MGDSGDLMGVEKVRWKQHCAAWFRAYSESTVEEAQATTVKVVVEEEGQRQGSRRFFEVVYMLFVKPAGSVAHEVVAGIALEQDPGKALSVSAS